MTREHGSAYAEKLSEQIVLGIAVAEMLAKPLGEGDPCLPAAGGAPLAHGLEVLIHTVMLS